MIEIKNISFSYPNNQKFQLKDITLQIERGKIIGITGESGCGKSTLARIISKLFEPNSGSINYNFEQRKSKINPIQMLFQNNEFLINPRRKVDSILNDIKHPKIDRDKLYEMIGITTRILSRIGYQLSGGERQKVALCRIMLTNPSVLILDEPFSSQDYNSNKNFINLFKEIQKSFNTTLVIISHDILLLRDLCEQIVVMQSGKIIEKNETENIFTKSNLDYTKKLISAAKYNLDC